MPTISAPGIVLAVARDGLVAQRVRCADAVVVRPRCSCPRCSWRRCDSSSAAASCRSCRARMRSCGPSRSTRWPPRWCSRRTPAGPSRRTCRPIRPRRPGRDSVVLRAHERVDLTARVDEAVEAGRDGTADGVGIGELVGRRLTVRVVAVGAGYLGARARLRRGHDVVMREVVGRGLERGEDVHAGCRVRPRRSGSPCRRPCTARRSACGAGPRGCSRPGSSLPRRGRRGRRCSRPGLPEWCRVERCADRR